MKRRKPWKFIPVIILLLCICLGGLYLYGNGYRLSSDWFQEIGNTLTDYAPEIFSGEPKEIRELRRQEVALTDTGHQEYYFGLLNEEEQRGYREMLAGIRARKSEFYLTIYDDNTDK